MSTVRTDLPQTAYYAHFLCIISVFLLLIPCALWSTHLAFYICTRCPWISWCLEKKNYCLLCQLCTTQLGWIYAFLLSTDWTCFSDAISSPSTYLSVGGSVGQSVIQSFRFALRALRACFSIGPLLQLYNVLTHSISDEQLELGDAHFLQRPVSSCVQSDGHFKQNWL